MAKKYKFYKYIDTPAGMWDGNMTTVIHSWKNPVTGEVIIKKGRLCLVKKCKNDWCKIKTGDYSGWVEKQNLRGRL